MKNHRLLLVILGAGLLALSVHAADWPQWRGPQRDGVSKETGLLKAWPKEGPKLLWQIKDAGGGYSTPAVVGERFYLLSNNGDDAEFVQARKVQDGSLVWSTKLGKVGPNQGPQYPGSRSTPTVDAGVLYALGSDGDLVCAKLTDGSAIWRKNLRKDFGGKPGKWAYAESPLVDGEVFVCTPGGKDATLVALDKRTGNLTWKSAVPGGDLAAYASVIIVNAAGHKQYVQFLSGGVVGVDAKTGQFLWRYDQTAKGSPANIPTPVAHDSLVFSATGKGGSALIKIAASGGKIVAEPVYYKKGLPTSIGGAVLLGDFLYGTNNNGLLCIEFATGKEKWQNAAIGAGAICAADGCLYLHGENGEALLVEATPDAYREKGRFTPPGQPNRGKSKAWAYPVVANGRLYLRDMNAVWCYDIAAAK